MRARRRDRNVRSRAAVALFLLLPALGVAAPATSATAQEEVLERGQRVYDLWCAACHGFEGDGLGPAADYMLPRPRDFTRGIYQIRTTRGGEIPTDDDLMRIINDGMPGTTMPGWRDQLSRRDREAVAEYLKTFYPPFETLAEPEPLDFGRAPRVTDEGLEEGRIFFDSIECYQCHGDSGRGEGLSAPELEDDRGYPLRAADLSMNWMFNGGGSVEDVYRRLLTGMDGTPMPAHADLIDAGFMTEDQLWNVAHYVRSLSPERPPRIRDIVRVERTEPGEVPATVDDERWEEVESFYFPLVGQILVEPRWFDPAVHAVWVQGAHDGEELALRFTWHDRSRSPDPRWMHWQERVIEVMEPREGEPHEPAPRPDRFTLQFPQEIPDGSERPYFLMGDDRNPVYLWEWRSDQDGAEEAEARGIHDIAPLGTGAVAADAHWEDGRWQLLLRRSLETTDAPEQIQFRAGESIPVAFYAWDGDHGEEGPRGAISTWYHIHLEEETPPGVFVAPLVAMAITAGLGFFVILRAQRRERRMVADGDDQSPVGPGGAAGGDPKDQYPNPESKEES